MVGLNIRLRVLRKERRMTQAQVADRVGITKAMVSAYETATRLPSYDILVRLASLFGVTTDYLLGLDNKRRLDVSGMQENHIELIVRMIDALRERRS